MPVSGLVLTLVPEARDALAAAMDAVGSVAGVTVGEPQVHGRLPVVTDTASLAAQKTCWDALAALPCVLHLDLVYEDFSDVAPEEIAAHTARRPRRERDNAPEVDRGSP